MSGACNLSWWQASNSLAIAASLAAALTVSAQDTNNTVPSGWPALRAATNSLPGFQVHPGFRVEVVAAAPLVNGPVALAFDENGRLFVVERPGELSAPAATRAPGRIRLLEDPGRNGRFGSGTVYAEDLPTPSALVCYGGGVFVGSASDILYLKDTKNQGSADERRIVFTGFGTTNQTNPQSILNSFVYGPDNRVYGLTAGAGGIITAPGQDNLAPVSLTGSDFSFEPRTLTLWAEAGPAQSGLTFDERGRRFVCDFTRPLRVVMADPRYADRNPFVTYLPPLFDAASPATPILHYLSVRLPGATATTLAATNTARPLALPEASILAAAWLTNARSCLLYRGATFPTNYVGNVFVADPSAHIIHRFVVHDHGLEPSATRAPDEETTEFLASREPTFRPMQIIAGPDGALYIADHQNGNATGRILRIVPQDFHRLERAPVGPASTRELVETLAQTDGWRADTAARLLCERRDPQAVPLLASMATRSHLPLARLRAVRVLAGLGALNGIVLLDALRDADYRVREQAVRLAEPVAASAPFNDQLQSMASDAALAVRYQLAKSLGALEPGARIEPLVKILSRDPDNLWMQDAILSSLSDCAGDMVVALARAQLQTSANLVGFQRRVAAAAGVAGDGQQVGRLVDFLAGSPPEPTQTFPLVYALGDGLHRAGSSLALADPAHQLAPASEAALNTAADHALLVSDRVAAVRLIGVSAYSFGEVSDVLFLLLGSNESPSVQSAALGALGRFDDPQVLSGVLARWSTLSAPLRTVALTTLLSRTNQIPGVLDATEKGALSRADIPVVQLNYLRNSPDPAIRQRALRLLGPAPRSRPELVQRYWPALTLSGDRGRGHELFVARCAACHQIGGEGVAVGPDLVAAKVSGKQHLLLAIVQPNAHRQPGWTTSVVQTKQGEVMVGLLGNQNLRAITVHQPGRPPAVWQRAAIEFIAPQPWSLMPDGLEEGLSTRDLASLLEFILASAR